MEGIWIVFGSTMLIFRAWFLIKLGKMNHTAVRLDFLTIVNFITWITLTLSLEMAVFNLFLMGSIFTVIYLYISQKYREKGENMPHQNGEEIKSHKFINIFHNITQFPPILIVTIIVGIKYAIQPHVFTLEQKFVAAILMAGFFLIFTEISQFKNKNARFSQFFIPLILQTLCTLAIIFFL